LNNPIVEKPTTKRMTALDQFRGYAVAGMVLVNFLGNYACAPRILRHTNDYCSYADTIMPNFLFAVGFSIAVVWYRALSKAASAMGLEIGGLDARSVRGVAREVQWRLFRRSLALMLFAFVLYFPWGESGIMSRISTATFWFEIWKRHWFQTLTHIAWTTLWLLPILSWSWRGKWCWIAGGATAHVVLSEIFYFHFVHQNPTGIDGGPLGFLTWGIPAALGLWAGEYWSRSEGVKREGAMAASWEIRWLAIAGAWMLAGWLCSCLTRSYDVDAKTGGADNKVRIVADKLARSPVIDGLSVFAKGEQRGWAELPFVPPPTWQERSWNYWMMSQRAGTLSYLVFAAGFSLGLFVIWDWVVRRFAIEVPLFRCFGRNALFCYALHGFMIDAIGLWVTKDAAAWIVYSSLMGLFAVLFGLAWMLERKRIFIRL
jgi:predicted acyltransferase